MPFCLTVSFKAATCTFWDVVLISDVELFCLRVILFYVKEFTVLLHSFDNAELNSSELFT